jgi:hypothetical protein
MSSVKVIDRPLPEAYGNGGRRTELDAMNEALETQTEDEQSLKD